MKNFPIENPPISGKDRAQTSNHCAQQKYPVDKRYDLGREHIVEIQNVIHQIPLIILFACEPSVGLTA
jgi:hypothetical protein